MNNKFDCIVVGAGNGGLVSACKVQKEGFKTLLIEKHNLPGGCATSFKRGRFEFEPSLHELCSVGRPGNPGSVMKIFNDLGVDIDWQYDDYLFRVINTGEMAYDIKVKNSIDGLADAVAQVCPKDRNKVYKLKKVLDDSEKAIEYITKKKGKFNKVIFMLKYSTFMKVSSSSVDEVLDMLKFSPVSKTVLGTYWSYLGVPTDELNAYHYFNMVFSYIQNGTTIPRYRSHELSLGLTDSFIKNGGTILYNTEVTEFLYDEEKKCIGVKSFNKEYYAKEVISNIHTTNLIKRSTEKVFTERDLKLASARINGLTFITAYIGLDITKEELGIDDYSIFIEKSPYSRYNYENIYNKSAYIVNCLNNVISDCSEKGTCMLFFTIPMFGKDFPKDIKEEDYNEWKNNYVKEYIKDFENIMHVDILNNIEEISIATPVTFSRYLGTPEGSIYGYQTNRWDNIMARNNAKKKDYQIKGLSIVGGTAWRGDGYSSAYSVGNEYALKVIKRLRGE